MRELLGCTFAMLHLSKLVNWYAPLWPIARSRSTLPPCSGGGRAASGEPSYKGANEDGGRRRTKQ
eukprot:362127-Chlamydomonas_euryale.AAC.2